MNLIKRAILFSALFSLLSGFTASGMSTESIWSLSSFGQDDFFHRPSDIEVDSLRSLIYVADSGNHRILIFNEQGQLFKIIGNKGQGPAEFANPTGLFLFEKGGFAVADVGNNRIQLFNVTGRHPTKLFL